MGCLVIIAAWTCCETPHGHIGIVFIRVIWRSCSETYYVVSYFLHYWLGNCCTFFFTGLFFFRCCCWGGVLCLLHSLPARFGWW